MIGQPFCELYSNLIAQSLFYGGLTILSPLAAAHVNSILRLIILFGLDEQIDVPII
jgi:hypothetical protein